jgi:hypothetical protein
VRLEPSQLVAGYSGHHSRGQALTEINIHIGTHGIAPTFVADVFEISDSDDLFNWYEVPLVS